MTSPTTTPAQSATAGTATNPSGYRRVRSLDGLRALALLAIMAFHFGVGWLQGGFLGVDVFYVLSGFLITSLLVHEYQRHQGIGLRAFWARRARRLLPALVLVVVAVTLCVRFLVPAGTYPGYRMNAFSALFYFSNWWQIATSSNYFVATGPVSPLMHTWSLAIEEQFYLVWPLVTLVVLGLSRGYRRGLQVLLALSVAGTIASATEMALLYGPGTPTTRLYFGTDTHAQSILVGAALACVMALVRLRHPSDALAVPATGRWNRRLLGAGGVVGLAVVVVLCITVSGESPFVYQGGFLVCAAATAAVLLAALCVPQGAIARLLTVRPLVALGVISYGGYLWHFPVYVFLTPARVGFGGPALMGVQFALTVVLSTASFFVVERPIMQRRFWRSVKALAPGAAVAGVSVAMVWVATAVPTAANTTVHRYAAPAAAQPAGHQAAGAAHGGPPPRVVVLGDSTADTLSFALKATAPVGTTVVNGSIFGCGLAIAQYSSTQMGKPQMAMFPGCKEDQPKAQRWPARDRAALTGTAPGDLVVFLAGDWETQDLERHGHWTNILSGGFRRYEAAQLDTLVRLATAHGAHLDLLTMAAMAAHSAMAASASGSTGPNPASSPRRRALYNQLLEATAARFPGKVSVVNYGGLLSPTGTFTLSLDGVQVRTPDGVHTPAYVPGNAFAGNSNASVAQAFYNWLSPRLWPLLVRSVHPAPTT